MTVIDRIREALIQGMDADVHRLADEALAAGIPAREVLEAGLIPAMEIVGTSFRTRKIFLPDVLLAARAMHAGLDILKPHLQGLSAPSRGTIVIGTVENDLHDIGKNLVGILLRGAGHQVVDLGIDVSPSAFVAAAKDHEAKIVGMRALLTTTMPVMGRVIGELKEAGLHDVKTIVGGGGGFGGVRPEDRCRRVRLRRGPRGRHREQLGAVRRKSRNLPGEPPRAREGIPSPDCQEACTPR